MNKIVPGILLGVILPALIFQLWSEEDSMPEMTTYYLVMLVKGPNWTPERTPELEELQKQHLAHITSMGQSGKMVIAGPFTDGGTIRGICVYKVESTDEAKVLAERDPAVKAGRLAVEVHPWMVKKGVLPGE